MTSFESSNYGSFLETNFKNKIENLKRKSEFLIKDHKEYVANDLISDYNDIYFVMNNLNIKKN